MTVIHVSIGEVKIGRSGDLLKATLGSCVGIAFVWTRKEKFGLAHCLLPETFEPSREITAKYVSQAIPSLIALMNIKESDRSEIKVYIAGGGDMMGQLSKKNTDHVGMLNLAAAKKYLTYFGFSFVELDSAGDDGRQILVDCIEGKVSVVRFEKAV